MFSTESNPQGSDGWFQERCGFATASRAADILAKGKNGQASATRANYLWDLVLERVTRKPTEGFSTAATDHGKRTEPFARMAFEAATGMLMEEVGFIKHPSVQWAGASPDGVCGSEGLEAKCRMPKGHGMVLLGGSIAAAQKQIDFQMWVCGFEAVWFVSYCPDFPKDLRLYFERVPRDESRIAVIESETIKFLDEVVVTQDRLLKVANASRRG